MVQPRRIDKTSNKAPFQKPKIVKKRPVKIKKKHPQYGTSKLEEYFAKNFLDKLGVKYTYQFEAKDIGRYYDFMIPNKDGSYGGIIVEVNGGYFHADPRLYEEKDLNYMQKKNMKVDLYKKEWALRHGFPIIYVWEKDIHENPKEVMKQLKERLYLMDEEIRKKGRNLGKTNKNQEKK